MTDIGSADAQCPSGSAALLAVFTFSFQASLDAARAAYAALVGTTVEALREREARPGPLDLSNLPLAPK